jgi:hypothetical protein
MKRPRLSAPVDSNNSLHASRNAAMAMAMAAMPPFSSSSGVLPVPAATDVRYLVGCKSYDGLRVQFLERRETRPEWTVGELIESAVPQLGLKVPVGHTRVYNVDPAIIKGLVNATAKMLSDEVDLDVLLKDVAPKRPSGRMNGVFLYVDVPLRVASSLTTAAIKGTNTHIAAPRTQRRYITSLATTIKCNKPSYLKKCAVLSHRVV